MQTLISSLDPEYSLFFSKKFTITLLLLGHPQFLSVFPEKSSIFVTRFKILKRQPAEVFLTSSQNWKENTHVFSSAYFIARANISFQNSIYEIIFSNLKGFDLFLGETSWFPLLCVKNIQNLCLALENLYVFFKIFSMVSF